ncbi:cyclic GMP-AMP synthase-like [Pogoniulus pusillus]|uniref:cyclic GMP-AMP synthase-like n=1 Tax=Pogoniulus pusillus TaxID=488313 RepID=UPI0030B9512C
MELQEKLQLPLCPDSACGCAYTRSSFTCGCPCERQEEAQGPPAPGPAASSACGSILPLQSEAHPRHGARLAGVGGWDRPVTGKRNEVIGGRRETRSGMARPSLLEHGPSGRGGAQSRGEPGRLGSSAGVSCEEKELPEQRSRKMPPAVQHSSLGGIGEGAEAMNGAGGRGERGRGASTAVGGNADRGSPGGAATLQEPQMIGATAGLGSPARPDSPVGDSSSGPAASGGEAAPAAERGAAVPERVQRMLQQIKSRREDLSDKADLVGEIVKTLIESFPTARFPAIVIPKGGIHCQPVKMSERSKFEVLLETAEERLELCQSDNSGASYNLRFKEEPRENPWSKFVENRYISASKMLATLRKMIKEKVVRMRRLGSAITVERKRPGNPAITLLITNPPSEISVDIILTVRVRQTSWPSSTQDGLRIEKWLGLETRESFMKKLLYFIPRENSWQLSFSHLEKLMMNNHGNTKTCCESNGEKCCREDCLELMKCLLEKLKDKEPEWLSIFSWQHIKASFFHSCVSKPGDQFWHSNQLGNCFKKVLEDFMVCLERSKLPHFFIPRYNLLSENYKVRNLFLAIKIKEEMEEGFEIFGC